MRCPVSMYMYVIPSLMLPALVLYIYAKFYILDFNVCCIIICVWCAEVLSCFTNIISCYINFNMRIIGVLYVKSSACCIATHLCYTIISIFVALSALIFVASTQIYVVSTQQINFAFKFVSGSTFSITPYSENLTLLFGTWTLN